MWYSEKDTHVSKVEHISDVYTEIKQYESHVLISIKYFNDVPAKRISDLYDYMANNIVNEVSYILLILTIRDFVEHILNEFGNWQTKSNYLIDFCLIMMSKSRFSYKRN